MHNSILSRLLILLTLVLLPVSAMSQQDITSPADVFRFFAENRVQDFSGGEASRIAAADFFNTVREVSGDKPVISVLRSMKRDMQSSGEWNQHRAQFETLENNVMSALRDAVLLARVTALESYARAPGNTGRFDTLYGIGDIGSWADRGRRMDFSMDVDWTLFGTNAAVTDPNRADGPIQAFAAELERTIGVDPAQVDVVATGSHWERQAGVYVTQGGQDWAISNFDNFQRLSRTSTGDVRLVESDPQFITFERRLTELRFDHTTQHLFDDNGNLRDDLTTEQLRTALDGIEFDHTKITSDKAAPGIMDMRWHQYHEGIQATELSRFKQMERSLKYASRGDTLYVKGLAYAQKQGIDPRAIVRDELGDFPDRMNELAKAKAAHDKAQGDWVRFCQDNNIPMDDFTNRETTALRDNNSRLTKLFEAAEAARMDYDATIEKVIGAGRDSQDFSAKVTEFENRVSDMLRFETEVAHKYRLWEILHMAGADSVAGRNQRRTALTDLAAQYRLLGQEYGGMGNEGEWHGRMLAEVDDISRLNDDGGLDRVADYFTRVDEYNRIPENQRKAFMDFLGKSELGQSIRNGLPESVVKNETLKFSFEPGSTRKTLTDLGFDRVGDVTHAAGEVVNILELAATCARAMTDSTLTDFEKAKEMGKLISFELASRYAPTSPLLLAYNGFNALKSGDPNEVAKFLLVMVIPQAMVPQLIESIGNSAISIGKTWIFDEQLQDMFENTTFDPEPGKEPVDQWMMAPEKVRYRFVMFTASTGSEYKPNHLDEFFERVISGEEKGSAAKTSGAGYFINKSVDEVFMALLSDGQHSLFAGDETLKQLLANQREIDAALDSFSPRPTGKDRDTAFTIRDYDVLIDWRNNTIKEASKDLSPGVRKAVESLLESRTEIQTRVRKRLAHLVVKTFEDRRRAMFIESMDLMGPVMDKLKALGKQLYVEKELISGAMQSMQGSMFSSQKAGDKGMALDKWVNAYSRVVDSKQVISGLGSTLGLGDNLLSGPGGPLSGAPTLYLDPDMDLALSEKARKEFSQIGDEITEVLFRLKGQAPDKSGTDADNIKTLSKLRFRAMLVEYWLRGINGAIPLTWTKVDTPQTDKQFADRIMTAAGKLNREPDDGWNAQLKESNLKLLRKTAETYNREVNRIRAEYQMSAVADPARLDLPRGKSVDVTLRPASPGTNLTWKVQNNAEFKITPANGKLSGTDPVTIKVEAIGSGVNKIQSDLVIKLVPEMLRLMPELRIDGKLPENTLNIPITVNPPDKTPVMVRLFEQENGKNTTTPVVQAKVLLKDSDGNTVNLSGSGRGFYGHKEIAPGQYTVVAVAPGFSAPDGSSSASKTLSVPGKDGGLAEATLYMVKSKGTLEVMVKDARTANVLQGAEVILTPDNGQKPAITQNGKALFRDIPPGKYSIRTTAKYYETTTKTSFDVKPGENQQTTLLLKPLLTEVRVQVVEASGPPLSSVLVTLGDKKAQTENGVAVFRDVLPSPTNMIKIKAELSGYPPATDNFTLAPEKSGNVVTRTLTLVPGGMISIVVRDKDTGQPVEGANVTLSGPMDKTVFTNASGRAVLDKLPAGRFYVDGSKTGYQSSQALEINLAGNDLKKTAVIELSQGVQVKVLVKDQQGQLIPGAKVSLDNGPQALAGTGTAQFQGVKPGNHVFKAQARGYSENQTDYVASPSTPDGQVEIKLKPGLGIVVEIRDPQGNLLNGNVSLIRDGKMVKTASGKAPMFSGLDQGTYKVSASAQGFSPAQSKPVTLTMDGDPTLTVSMTLQPDAPVSSTIEVRVVDDKGNPVHADQLSVSRIKGVMAPAMSDIVSGSKHRFNDLPAGTYQAHASAPGYKNGQSAHIELPGIQPVTVIKVILEKEEELDKPVGGNWSYSSYADKHGQRTYRQVKLGGHPVAYPDNNAVASFCSAQGLEPTKQTGENTTNWQGELVDSDGNIVCRTQQYGGTEYTCKGFINIICKLPPEPIDSQPCDPNDPLCGLDVDVE